MRHLCAQAVCPVPGTETRHEFQSDAHHSDGRLCFAALRFTMNSMWPRSSGTMDERARKIALGLEAAEQRPAGTEAGEREVGGHHPRGPRPRAPDHRSGAAPRQRGRRGGQGHGQHEGRDCSRPRSSRSSSSPRARAKRCARKWRALAVRRRLQATRARDRRDDARGSARQARRADLRWLTRHNRPTLRARGLCGGAGSAGSASWSQALRTAAEVVTDPRVAGAARQSARDSRATVAAACSDIGGGRSVEHGRTSCARCAEPPPAILPEIAALFDEMKDEAENIADVTVTSAAADLDDKQQHTLAAALERRLKREVRLHSRSTRH